MAISSTFESKLDGKQFLAAFESLAKIGPNADPSWLVQRRREAIDFFSKRGFPTTHEEDWRYTNVSPIAQTSFQFHARPKISGLQAKEIEPFDFSAKNWNRLVFVNAFYFAELSSPSQTGNGVSIGNLRSALDSDPRLIERHLGQVVSYDRNSFAALNTAFAWDGAFIVLPEGKILNEPIHLLFVSSSKGANLISSPRVLVIAGKKSRATIIEHYVSVSGDAYFTNAVTEIVVGEGASIDHYKIQRESTNAFHIGTTQVQLERDSRFNSASISMGAKLSRDTLHVGLNAEGAECVLNGLYLAAGEQHVDHHTLMDHPKPRGRSHQLYKGIISGKANAVFNGRVFVHRDAQKTDAEQSNKNLLLSEEATVDTKPELEIFADDVKCTHGAAVGQLDQDAIFYLNTRGIDREAAGKLLAYGFANEVIQKIGVEAVRVELSRFLLEMLEGPSFFGKVKVSS